MATHINNPIVFREARELVRRVATISADCHFGDLGNQLRRSAVSVASNICEGAGSGSDRQFARYARMARASANECLGQLLLATDLGLVQTDDQTAALADRISRRLTCLIRRLVPD